MTEVFIKSKERRERQATPIYVKIEPPPTDEQIELVRQELQKCLQDAYERFEKIPYTEDGCKRVEELLKPAFEKILPQYTVSMEIKP